MFFLIVVEMLTAILAIAQTSKRIITHISNEAIAECPPGLRNLIIAFKQ